MNFISLFAGIGGIDLGLERAGMRCVAQVEIDPFCRRVLAKHWPDVPRFEDVREVVAWLRPVRRLPRHLLARQTAVLGQLQGVDLIAGGFPCQDISNAGKRAGIWGARSGLWSEYRRIISAVRPRYVLVENVSALLIRGLDRVLGDLAACGYDAEWDCIPATAVGAPHIRDRLFLVAHAQRAERWSGGSSGRELDDATVCVQGEREEDSGGTGVCGAAMADAAGAGRTGCWTGNERQRDRASTDQRAGEPPRGGSGRGAIPHPVFAGLEGHERGIVALADYRRHNADPAGSGWWATEPRVGRVADGIPSRVDRLKGLGNAVVPQVAEWIGRRILAASKGGVA